MVLQLQDAVLEAHGFLTGCMEDGRASPGGQMLTELMQKVLEELALVTAPGDYYRDKGISFVTLTGIGTVPSLAVARANSLQDQCKK